ncbi:putative bifunctional diguanylate cyclase/phosphodiesterase [Qipengyuania zhejiangensis]|uniref:putative bifunctional diguanylate cyclase/phosphodiesterase n=1 Tax=Qipengyuania zhejiangensis TaxID=3077782 RepID=UPI002D798CA7|nr:EAL domain-containing protein [Qipengyuania sp. Z2]
MEDGTEVRGSKQAFARKEHDFVTLGIAIAAIILFVGTAGVALPTLFRAWNGNAPSPDLILTNALLLNIALILLGWNRYKILNAELVQRRHSEKEARRLAEIDHLTGCHNRRSFTAALGDLLASQTRPDRAFAAIAVDLDNFKQVNDLNGHQAGDEVLCVTAGRIAGLLPEGGLLARLGGDEFVCVVPFHPQVPDRIDHLATRMVEIMSSPVRHDGVAIDVTISIGIASSTELDNMGLGPISAQKLMHKADIAMYHAKKQGKNRFYWFETPMENELRFRNELEAGIRKGIALGEFKPYYEQQIDLTSGKLVGFEMLARWESPEMGVVGPDIFIPIAEEIGVIGDMSERLIAQAFEDAKAWSTEITLSVNISPVQMRDPWFAQKLLKLMVKHNFPANRLDIEITESCLHENIGMVRTMITSLRNQGVHISLDDFGTGYSSLSQLRSLPFDRLKIDRSFISELKEEEHNGKLVDAIISMGDGLKLPITAEGVENEVVLEALKRMGNLKGQGYHYGRPEPADLVIERLAKQNLLARPSTGGVAQIGLAERSTEHESDAKAG